MTEYITLTVELAEDGRNAFETRTARYSMRIPYDCRTIVFGPWLDQAIKDLRSKCKARIDAQKAQGL